MLLLKSIASSHSTLGGKILLNLTSSADSEQVKAWMQMSVEKQGETDQRGVTGPATTAQKEAQGGEMGSGTYTGAPSREGTSTTDICY